MSADPNNKPAVLEQEAEVIDFEVVEEGTGGVTAGPSLEDFAKAGPEIIRAMLKERLKRWFIRSLAWGTVLGLFAQDSGLMRWIFGIWAFVAFIRLAILLFIWYAAGKQGAKLVQMFGGMGRPGPQ